MKSGLRRSVPYLNFWTSQSCFLSSNWFSKCEHWYTDKPLVITKARCTRVLNFITATSRICSIKIISYMYTVCEKGASKWKGLLVWLATLQWLQHTCTCFRMTFLLILGCGRHRLWDFWHISLPTNLVPRVLSYPSLWTERERDPRWVWSHVSGTGLSESFEVDGWVVNVSGQRWRCKPLGGSGVMLPKKMFIFRRSEMLFSALSRLFSIPSCRKSKVNYITACRH